ncbi:MULTISPECIES: hypothetical protein [unclassified Aeromicrobium]|uniref:hypothetical protein n=1 Tax=unclassified Aeromicrobium TaxID=2633570 RepID=UPI00288A3520|nr:MULTISPECIES: hypothetical protein [unclassified Aeromicrobium]
MSARNAAVRAAIIKFLIDQLRAAETVVKAEVTEHLDRGDRKHARLDDDTDVATVSVSDPKGTTKVVGRETFLAWVEDNYPTAIVTTKNVSPAWEKSFLDRLDVGDHGAVDTDTGELVPGVERRVGDPTVSTRISPAQLAALAEAFRDGRIGDHVREIVTDTLAIES